MALSNLFQKKANTDAVYAMLRESLKKGKTPEQCKCIDFLVKPDDVVAKKGCMSKLKGEMDMAGYLAHVQARIDSLDLRQRAIDKIGLDESQISEIPPVLISYFDLKARDGLYIQSEESKVKGIYTFASNVYHVTWIFFSSTQLYTYTYIFDAISDNAQEITHDFFYTDITCIKTAHEVEEHIIARSKGCGCFKKATVDYVHANKHFDSLDITVPGNGYSFVCRTNDTIEQSIQAAKAMIREKKYMK